MNAREVIVIALKPFSHLPERDASYVIGTLKENCFTIMSKEDVEAVRDKALEEAASKIETMLFTLSIGTPEDGPFTRQNKTRDEVCKQASAAIRSLKSKEGKIDR